MGKVLAILKRGTKGFGVVLTRVLEVLTILNGGGAQKVSTLQKGGCKKCLPCLEGGSQKVSDPQFSHFVAPPPPSLL